jgi:predicted N-acyltransferase
MGDKTMACSVALHDRFDQINANDWSRIVSRNDLAMDLRLLTAFQQTMTDQCRCWGLIVHDQAGAPVAAAALALFTVDGADTTSPLVKGITNRIRNAMPGFMRFRVLFCGLPVPGGEHHLRLSAAADRDEVLGLLHRTMTKLAMQHHARLLVIKELPESPLTRALEKIGYVPGEIPPEHRLEATFPDFDAYRLALKSDYRKQITRSEKLFTDPRLRILDLRGDAAADAFTAEVHQLYAAVWATSKYRLEFLPPEFFRATARAMDEQASLSLVLLDRRAVAFSFGLTAGDVHFSLYVGLDYPLNDQYDLYFNLYHHDLDRAFRRGVRVFRMGQTSDAFKARLGAVQQTLHAYAFAPSPLLNFGLQKFAKYAFPPVPRVPEHQVFKQAVEKPRRARPLPLDAATASSR